MPSAATSARPSSSAASPLAPTASPSPLARSRSPSSGSASERGAASAGAPLALALPPRRTLPALERAEVPADSTPLRPWAVAATPFLTPPVTSATLWDICALTMQPKSIETEDDPSCWHGPDLATSNACSCVGCSEAANRCSPLRDMAKRAPSCTAHPTKTFEVTPFFADWWMHWFTDCTDQLSLAGLAAPAEESPAAAAESLPASGPKAACLNADWRRKARSRVPLAAAAAWPGPPAWGSADPIDAKAQSSAARAQAVPRIISGPGRAAAREKQPLGARGGAERPGDAR
mmetsp:Transcript_20416/g.78476  ORF Transcript_20416/g.78476 Transcript_20416/m.78476 type:complete len:290 (+) Transcript_20416:338-1207(+)